MLPTKQQLADILRKVIEAMHVQGYDTAGMASRLDAPMTYDQLIDFSEELRRLPMRSDWAYNEPVLFDDIEREMAPGREACLRESIDVEECEKKAEAAFLGSVLGCILGKPLEVNPSYSELKAAGLQSGQWPIDEFISDSFLQKLGRRHPSWTETAKGCIRYVAADDDLNYSVLGMINLEDHGLSLDLDGVKNTWLKHQCLNFVFGPERKISACIAADHFWKGEEDRHEPDEYYRSWADTFNPGNELCGAAIRADAYGYAFPGRPDLAARYACIDASFTHRRTGVYSTMFIAAAIAGMFYAHDPVQPFIDALKFVPQKSRFAANTRSCIEYVVHSRSFEEGYERIHQRFGQYDHCMLYQEVGTLINTLKYARDVWDGVCRQVMQGNDTDSFGCTAGSLLGARFGYEGLDTRRLEVFNDLIHISLADFYEFSLSGLAARMGRLVRRFAG